MHQIRNLLHALPEGRLGVAEGRFDLAHRGLETPALLAVRGALRVLHFAFSAFLVGVARGIGLAERGAQRGDFAVGLGRRRDIHAQPAARAALLDGGAVFLEAARVEHRGKEAQPVGGVTSRDRARHRRRWIPVRPGSDQRRWVSMKRVIASRTAPP